MTEMPNWKSGGLVFRRPERRRVGPYTSYGLTALGRTAIERQSYEGMALGNVLDFLDENGPSKASQIARDLPMPYEKVKFVLKRAILSDYVVPVSHE